MLTSNAVAARRTNALIVGAVVVASAAVRARIGMAWIVARGGRWWRRDRRAKGRYRVRRTLAREAALKRRDMSDTVRVRGTIVGRARITIVLTVLA